MKRFLSFFMVLAIVFSVLPVSGTAIGEVAFDDIGGNWAEGAIARWSGHKVVIGLDNKFRPDEPITRAELVTVINRIIGYFELSGNSFIDVNADDWFYDDIMKLHGAGVAEGDGGYMRPNDPVTRQEAAVMIARAFNLEGGSEEELGFSDAAEIADWARAQVAAMYSAGYIQGYNNEFNPLDNITRAETVTIFDNMIAAFYNEPGTYSGDVEGIVVVRSPGVILEDMEISGSLYIMEGADGGSVKTEGVSVTGVTYVRGGSVVAGGSYGRMLLSAPNSAVSAVGAAIGGLTVTGENSKVILDEKTNLKSLELNSDNSSADIAGTVSDITVEGSGNKITVSKGGKAGTIAISGGNNTVTGSGTLENAQAISGTGNTITTPGTQVAVSENAGPVTTGKDKEIASGSNGISQDENGNTITGGGGNNPDPGDSDTYSAAIGIAPASLTLEVGYVSGNTAEVTITNTGTATLSGLSLEAGGDFSLGVLSSVTLAPGATATATLTFTAGKAAGTYETPLTLKRGADTLDTKSFSAVVQTVSAAIGIDPTSLVLEAGYSSGNTAEVTITNTGTATLSGLSLEATGGDFSLDALSATTLAPGSSATATLALPTGKTANTYNTTLTLKRVDDTLSSESFSATVQTVSAAIGIDPTYFTLGTGYVSGNTAQVTITNTGAATLSGLSLEATGGDFSLGALSATTLAPGSSATATLTLPTGKTANTYNTTLTLKRGNTTLANKGFSAIVTARIRVVESPRFAICPSDGTTQYQLTYSEYLTPTTKANDFTAVWTLAGGAPLGVTLSSAGVLRIAAGTDPGDIEVKVTGSGGVVTTHTIKLNSNAFAYGMMASNFVPKNYMLSCDDRLISEIILAGFNFAPRNYAECDGALLSLSQNTALFNIFGSNFGGNGTNNFALPSLYSVGNYYLPPKSGADLSLPKYLISSVGIFPARDDAGAEHFVEDRLVRSGKDPGAEDYFTDMTGQVLYVPSKVSAPSNGDLFLGEIVLLDSSRPAPTGVALCNGQELSINTNQALYSLVGINYGGNGSTTFALPDLRGKSPIIGLEYHIATQGIYPARS